MTRYISREALIVFGLIVAGLALIWPSSGIAQSQGQHPTQPNEKRWEDLNRAGDKYLKQASECLRTFSVRTQCSPQEYLKKASKIYEAMGAELDANATDSHKILTVANGLVKSGHAYDALAILERNNIREDASAVHLMGDILYSMGDYRSAASAYRRWIELGCKGYLLDPDDPSLWVLKKDLSRCSNLPPLMRARLEYIEERLPEEDPGFGLPKINLPAVRSTAR
jgi:tetratricopeptide (TPR) repeat protein